MKIQTVTTGVAVVFLLAAISLQAQTHPGLTFDQVIHSVSVNGGATTSDSAVMHAIATTGNIRMEISGALPGMRRMSNGKPMVMLITDGGAKMTFLSPTEKQYMSFNPLEMMEGARKMMEGMGGGITVDTAATKISYDSVGAGPTIMGHPTVHYRGNSRFRVLIAMMGNNADLDLQSTEDIYSATDLDDLRSISIGMTKFNDLGASFGFPTDLSDRLRKAHEAMRGFPLRVVKQETRTTRGVTVKSTTTMEVTKASRLDVPDSVFAIPADYKQLAMPMMPGVPPQ